MASRGRQIAQVDRIINMPDQIFQPAIILLPADIDMTKWSTIACDQFTSDAAYWEAVDQLVGTAPSTLRLMLPEYYLGKCDEEQAALEIRNTMQDYLDSGLFRTISHSFIYLERTLPGGTVRRGLIGQVDLEAYDYSRDSRTPIRATEGTVESRLPARVEVRRNALFEMPHIMLFFNDESDAVMRSAAAYASGTVYDFDLMLGGGHALGRSIQGSDADRLADQIALTVACDTLKFAVGDGNHSLAAARKLWLEKREALSPEQRMLHPSRYALVELVNIHDPAITFEPIHRVLLHTNTDRFFEAARAALFRPDADRSITLLANGKRAALPAAGSSIGETIELTERFCRDYTAQYGGEIDYIHGEPETAELAAETGAAGILLPYMNKNELFSSVARTGPFPQKSFSIGLGPDKRYYLECRTL